MGLAEKFARIDAAALAAGTFEEFWRLYPRRVAKRAALKSWERELRNGTPAEVILGGLRRQLPMWSQKDSQFIPHPATWLNNARWEDEIPAAQTQSTNGRRSIIDAARDRLHREGLH